MAPNETDETTEKPPVLPRESLEKIEKESREITAPDGGYGWVILLAAFLCNVIVDGMCFAFGIYYIEFIYFFDGTRSKTAWVGSVLNGTYMVMGPVVGALVNKYGCRTVAIIGSIWSAAAFCLCTLSPNVDWLIFTYGALGGIGFGLMYLPSIVIVGYYFDKRRAFATGIATCGSGIGAFIFAPLCRYLIDVYAWKGAMWVCAGIVFNGAVFGALYRPIAQDDIEKLRQKYVAERKKIMLVKIEKDEENSGKYSESSSYGNEKEYFIAEDIVYFDGMKLSHIKDVENTEGTQPLLAVSNIPSKRVRLDHIPDDSSALRQSNTNDLAEDGYLGSKKPSKSNNEDSSYLRRTLNIGDSWHSLSFYGASIENVSKLPPKCAAFKEEKTNVSCHCLKDIFSHIKSTTDLSMLKNPVFIIYGFSCILCMTGFFVPFIYLPDNAITLGNSPERAAFLLSILGITNTIGRVVTGWISDRPWADCLLINNCALVLGGGATVLCPFCQSYVLLAFYATIFGLCIAAFVSLRSIILVDLVGLDKLTSAFGIIVLCQGITSFVGAPIAGFFYDVTGSYDTSFYVAGVTIALAGVINFPLRWVAKNQSSREREAGESI